MGNNGPSAGMAGHTIMADFRFCLNTSTIQPTGLLEKIRIAGQTGYGAIELWSADVEAFAQAGGNLTDVRKALDDHGLERPSMIALKGWCEAEAAKHAAAQEDLRRRIDSAQQLGVQRIVASPPLGAVAVELATERYGQLLELSVGRGVPASLEFLGFATSLNTLARAWEICAGTGSADATITADAWHLFRGDSKLDSLDDIPPDHLAIFHWDDAPASLPRAQQTDADRVFPGDGLLPLKTIAEKLRHKEWRGYLSLELFHRGYWQRDPVEVARIGLEKMKASVGA